MKSIPYFFYGMLLSADVFKEVIELGNYYEAGNGRCIFVYSRQYCYDRIAINSIDICAFLC
ncbi:MAG: hypothetical protein K2N15_14995 [Lachnospiraceae bacterium]|nr:hypothetical protein [Lachnospiraceae bacterium]